MFEKQNIRLKNLRKYKALKELTNGWFPSAYLSPNVVLTFIDYMKKKRATTMKELANLYEMDKLYAHQMQMTQESKKSDEKDGYL